MTSLRVLQQQRDDEEDTLLYTSPKSIMEFQDALRAVIDKQFDKDRSNAPYGFYSLEVDEATDVANLSSLVICIRFVKDGRPTSQFLAVRELKATRAVEIYEAITSALKDKNLPLEQLVGMATDGAAVMLGVRNGVTTKFKQDQPTMITTHCMAHRLQLVSEKAANQVPYLVKYIAILNSFAKALKFSPKLCRALEQAKILHGEKARKIKQVFFTWWLSLRDSVQALSGCLNAVISCLVSVCSETGCTNKAVLQGVCKQMATYKFCAMTHFLADAVGFLGILNLTMQKETISYYALKPQISATVDSLKKLLVEDGPFTKSFQQDVFIDNEETVYKTHVIKDGDPERKKYSDSAKQFIQQLVDRLECTFPDGDILGAFNILNPQKLPTEPCDRSHYGDEELAMLLNHYEHNNLFDSAQCQFEWTMLKSLMENYTEMDTGSFYRQFLMKNKDTFVNMTKLAALSLTLPVTSVNCERAISAYNLIKTDRRNKLGMDSTETQLLLMLEPASVHQFDFAAAFELWLQAKDRRGFAQMTREVIPAVSGSEQQLLVDWPLASAEDQVLDLSAKP